MHAAAAAAEYFPLSQSVHALAPPAEYLPAAQSRQSDAAEFEYRPGEHGEHKYWAPFDTVPARHAEQHDCTPYSFGSQSSADGYCALYAVMAPAVEEQESMAEFYFPKKLTLQPFITTEPVFANTSKYKLSRGEDVPSTKNNVADAST